MKLYAGLATKTILTGIIMLSTTALSSCLESNTPSNKVNIDEKARNITPLNDNLTTRPSVLRYFSCKPAENAFVAAHRGTQEGSEFPENAAISLQALINKNVDFAEIDVAQLKDGTLITFHDGSWERRTVGPKNILSIPLAATDWTQSQKLLLKDTTGKTTASRPSSFKDVLTVSKNKIFLEIDFKSTADEGDVIKAIRNADMLDQVILIAYSTEQAKRLHKLAPSAALSVGVFKPSDLSSLVKAGIPTSVMTAWTGKGPLSNALITTLRNKNIPILAASFYEVDDEVIATGNTNLYTQYAKAPDLVVSDKAFDAQQVLEIKGNSLKKLNACLTNKPK